MPGGSGVVDVGTVVGTGGEESRESVFAGERARISLRISVAAVFGHVGVQPWTRHVTRQSRDLIQV